MAPSDKVRARKWIKPFIAFLGLTLASILVYENMTSGMESGAVFVDNGEGKNGKSRVHKSQTPLGETTVGFLNKSKSFELQTTVSNSDASSPSPSVRINNMTSPLHTAGDSSNVYIGGGNSCEPTANCNSSKRLRPEGKGTNIFEESDRFADLELKNQTEDSSSDLSVSSNMNEEAANRANRSIKLMIRPIVSNLSVLSSAPPSFPKAPMSARKPNLLSRIFSMKDAFLGNITKSENPRKIRKRPVFIVLLARMRTGSTLIGEIFNQNPDVGFLYEPLHALCDWHKRGIVQKSKLSFTATNLLDKLSMCEFSPNFISSIVQWPTGGGTRSSLISPVCAITKSCRHATSKMLRHYCLKFQKYRGVKTIRADLEIIRPLVEKGEIDVKILHLIRDPRGTANSRRQVYYQDSNALQRRLAARSFRGRRIPIDSRRVMINGRQIGALPGHQTQQDFPGRSGRLFGRGTRLDVVGLMNTADVFPLMNTIPAYCQWLQKTIDLARQRPAWLRGRYKMIRYEDYAKDPLSVTKDIYRYFDMVLPENVRTWIANNTSGDISRSDGLYGSHRNSSGTAFKWRKDMLTQEALQVERECGDIMERLGYLTISHNHLRLGDFQHSLIRPLPDDITREL